MSIDIGGSTIGLVSSNLVLNTASAPINLTPAGYVQKPNQVAFIANGDPSSTWVYPPDAQWNKIPLTSAAKNIGGGYNTSLSRFTAPVAGSYYSTASTYLLKDGASISYYCHPVFYVNGTGSTFNSNGAYFYRIRGHGQDIGSAMYMDGQISQIYRLSVGDYVEYYHYTNSAGTLRYYNPNCRFAGVLLG